jgi:hypothetical protein
MKITGDYKIGKMSPLGGYIEICGGFESAFSAKDFLLNRMFKGQNSKETLSKYRIAYVETTHYDLEEIE